VLIKVAAVNKSPIKKSAVSLLVKVRAICSFQCSDPMVGWQKDLVPKKPSLLEQVKEEDPTENQLAQSQLEYVH